MGDDHSPPRSCNEAKREGKEEMVSLELELVSESEKGAHGQHQMDDVPARDTVGLDGVGVDPMASKPDRRRRGRVENEKGKERSVSSSSTVSFVS